MTECDENNSKYGPIVKEDDDILHRSDVVDQLVHTIESLDNSSHAIGISGKWGSGKTSVINLFKKKVDPKHIIVDFDPWIFSDQADLTKQFFSTLGNAFRRRSSSTVAKHLSIITDYLEPILGNYFLFRLIRQYSHLLSDPHYGCSLASVKEKISRRLSKLEKRLIIVIDNIDRLEPDEIRSMMKLVRSVADFSNTIYLIAYDDEVVSKALTCNSYGGTDYLQKIIPLTICLPEIGGIVLNNVLNEQLKQITSTDLSDDPHHRAIMEGCITPFIYNLRDTYILLDRFRIKFTISSGNTNISDLLAITLLEMKDKAVFNWVYHNRFKLCDPSYTANSEGEISKMINLYNEKEMNPDYIRFISVLFPLFDKDGYGAYCSGYVKNHRITVPRYVDNYYLLVPSLIPIPRSKIDYLVDDALPMEIMSEIVQYSEMDLLIEVFEEINDALSDSTIERKKLWADMMMFSDELTNPGFSLSCPLRVRNCSDIVLQYVSSSGLKLIDYMRGNIPTSLSSITHVMALSQSFGCFTNINDPENLSEDDVQLFENVVLEVVKAHYKSDLVIYDSYLFCHLSYFISIRNSSLLSDILEYFLNDSDDVVHFVSRLIKTCPSNDEIISVIKCIRLDLMSEEAYAMLKQKRINTSVLRPQLI